MDNDAFDFWMPVWDRPDEEYTSGVDLTLEQDVVPRWARPFVGQHSHCEGAVIDCLIGSHAIGQDMYTPERHIDDNGPPPGSRPNAGWLYYATGTRLVSDATSRQLTITIGATGRPSFAQQTQELFHSLAAQYNRPSDWSHQVPFEPGLIVRYAWAGRTGIGLRRGSGPGASFEPRLALSAGNVITEAEGGAGVRAGWSLPNPWLPQSSTSPFRLDVSAGASVHAVAYSAFLDGTMFRGHPYVQRTPIVPEHELAAEVSWQRFGFGYRAVTKGSEYRTHPGPHSWASLTGEVRF